MKTRKKRQHFLFFKNGFIAKINKSVFILLTILILALFLRLLGTNPGYPFTHADEPTIVDAVSRIVIYNDLKPGGYWYGSLLPIIYAVFNKLVFIPIFFLFIPVGNPSLFIEKGPLEFLEYFGKEHHYFLYWARYETAILSAFTVVVVYLLGKKLFNRQVGLIAAFLTAVNYRHVLSSTFALSDAPSAFFAVLSVLLSVRLLSNSSIRKYILAGVGLALAFSVKYFVYVLPVFLICHAFSVWQFSKSSFSKKIIETVFSRKLIITLFLCIILFFIINPYLLLDYKRASAQLAVNALRYRLDNPLFRLSAFLNGITTYEIYSPLRYLYWYGLGEVLSFAIILGYIYGFIKYTKQTLIISCAVFPFFLTYLVISGIGAFVRNYSSIIPFLTFFPAILIVSFTKIIPFKKFSMLILLLLTFVIGLQSLSNSFISSYSSSKKQNNLLLFAWIKNNIPDNSRIATTLDIPGSEEKLFKIFKIDPSGNNAFLTLDELKEEKVQWVIIESSFTALHNASAWANNKEITKLSFNKDLYTRFLENRYLSLALEELAGYRVKEFVKPFWQSVEPSFFVVKIPDFGNFSSKRLLLDYDFNKQKNDSYLRVNSFLPCGYYETKLLEEEKTGILSLRISKKEKTKNLDDCSAETQFLAKTFPVLAGKQYIFNSSILRDYNVRNKDYGNGFLRLDFYSIDNKRLKSYVSRQAKPSNEWQQLNVFGVAPDKAKYAKTSFQLDSYLAGEKYYLSKLQVFMSDSPIVNELEYPYAQEKMPQNFIWSIDL